ncbi:ImmA/IrrE family metallo-endopeptidase [Nocardia wallacei]|uniref:ImmA/IrrE family metallo-endopeptidase n=1 Tax=Nocardia wallacei TaxID=480035 RepID=UPI003CC7E186
MSTPTAQIHLTVGRPRVLKNGPTIVQLRSLAPRRSLTIEQSLRVAIQQANAVTRAQQSLKLIPIELISGLRRVRVEYSRDQQIPRASFWDVITRQWVIQLRMTDTWKHHRFNIAHEFKHIIDHGRETSLYPGESSICAACRSEEAADHFAKHFLVPDRLLRRAQRAGHTNVDMLADFFGVPEEVMAERLDRSPLGGRQVRRLLTKCTSTTTEHTGFLWRAAA